MVLSGAGISAESGLKTFRDGDGLWENHRVEDVATPVAWHRNPELVLKFYNERRTAAALAQPNKAHVLLADLEKHFKVTIVTQNVDDLHERAGSSHVIHLHGELTKARSSNTNAYVVDIGSASINVGDKAEDGSQLRPHIVWFGEEVPLIPYAASIFQEADIVLIVGTSLQVYPAAGLFRYAPSGTPLFLVDRIKPEVSLPTNTHLFLGKATEKMEEVYRVLSNDFLA